MGGFWAILAVDLSEWDIKNIHWLVLKTIDDNNAGAYRTENVIISGAKHRPPQHLFVKELIGNLIKQYNVEWQGLYPIERAALLHGEFVIIHPFVDGNGRTARLSKGVCPEAESKGSWRQIHGLRFI
ncbi:MAG TPA: Fic family protein [Desulfosporosinus sp.]|nr:Fic family protein [Desulfosporosinus sp.]